MAKKSKVEHLAPYTVTPPAVDKRNGQPDVLNPIGKVGYRDPLGLMPSSKNSTGLGGGGRKR